MWRPMGDADLPVAEAIAEQVHPDHPEDPAVFAERLRLFPAGCFMLGEAGYLIAHPWMLAHPPKLDTLLRCLPAVADTLFVHDLALMPAARGRGDAQAAVDLVRRLAADMALPRLSLVSVGRASAFWRRQGFVPLDDAAIQAGLSSYGPTACYMVRHGSASL